MFLRSCTKPINYSSGVKDKRRNSDEMYGSKIRLYYEVNKIKKVHSTLKKGRKIFTCRVWFRNLSIRLHVLKDILFSTCEIRNIRANCIPNNVTEISELLLLL